MLFETKARLLSGWMGMGGGVLGAGCWVLGAGAACAVAGAVGGLVPKQMVFFSCVCVGVLVLLLVGLSCRQRKSLRGRPECRMRAINQKCFPS